MKKSLAVLLCLLALPAAAETRYKIIHYLAGTGFFVSRDGHIVTNNHVVQNCTALTVSGAVSKAPAKLLAVDKANDLALLKTDAPPSAVAELREGPPPEQGERVVVVGYPGNRSLTTREASFISAQGPRGEARWVQFSDAVAQGNSGGPLLDASANVVGVVVAKGELYQENLDRGTRDLVSKSDLALALPVLKGFLNANAVRYRENLSGGLLAAHRVEDRARQYVVSVHCQQKS